MHGVIVVELVDLAPVALAQLFPAHFLDKDPVSQTIGLLHRLAKQVLILWRNDMDHLPLPHSVRR